MKVMCIHSGSENPFCEYVGAGVKEGSIYTVKAEHKGYSDWAQRQIDCYEFYELQGYYEKTLFAPLSNFNEKLLHLINTKPLKKNKKETA